MINGNIGEEGWREASNLIIQRNKASEASIMVNTSQSVDRFKELLAARNETVRLLGKRESEGGRENEVRKGRVEKIGGRYPMA